MKAVLYKGQVMHRRLKPVQHRFIYRVFSMLIDLDALDDLDCDLKFFSHSRFNLFSFYDKDYGPKSGDQAKPDSIAKYVRVTMKEAGVDASGSIQLLCYPRILGHAFNPLAVYYCHDSAGCLSAILYEVSNTFGERHSYLIPVIGNATVIRQKADKLLHVSPFMEMDMRYHFHLSKPGETLSLLIRETDYEGPILTAAFIGEREEVSDRVLLQAFFQYPLMTMKIIAGIHWEAMKLFAKGLRLLKGAPAPDQPVTVVRQEQSEVHRAA